MNVLARAVSVPVGRLATTLVATIFIIFCQAQPQLNSTQLQLKLRLSLALVPFSPPTQPPEKVVYCQAQPRLNLNSTQSQG